MPKDLAAFYHNDRKITGKHTLYSMTVNGNIVTVDGKFQGIGIDGSQKEIGFADFWTFNDKGLIILRKTYLAAGAHYVKE